MALIDRLCRCDPSNTLDFMSLALKDKISLRNCLFESKQFTFPRKGRVITFENFVLPTWFRFKFQFEFSVCR